MAGESEVKRTQIERENRREGREEVIKEGGEEGRRRREGEKGRGGEKGRKKKEGEGVLLYLLLRVT